MGSCGARRLSRLQAWQGPINEVDPAPDGLGRRARRPSHAEAPKKGMSPRTARLEDITSQRDALEKLAELIRKGSIDQEILRAAKAVTRDCSARDDLCELEALFQAVKYGDSRVAWLKKGMRYVADPYPFDTRSEEHTSELQSRLHLVCRVLLLKK